MTESRRRYYWLVCRDNKTDRIYLIAGGKNEEEARSKGLEMLGGIDFEIKALPTTNLQSASSMIRGKRLEDTHSLNKAKQRLGHDRSINRLKRRRNK